MTASPKLNIPLQLIEHCARSKQIRPLKVFLALKFIHGGQVRADRIDWNRIRALTGWKDRRTIKRHLQAAAAMNWTGTDGRWIFIRSFERVREITGSATRTAVQITPDKVPHILEYSLYAKVVSRSKARRHARKRAGAKPTAAEPFTCLHNPALCDPYPDQSASVTLIASWYATSPATAHRIKRRAMIKGWTRVKHRFKKIGAHRANFGLVSESIPGERLAVHGDQLVIRLSDVFYPARHAYHLTTRPAI